MNNKIFFIIFFLTFKFSYLFSHEGMWIPSLLKIIEGDMQSNGLELTAEDIYSINKSSLKDGDLSYKGSGISKIKAHIDKNKFIYVGIGLLLSVGLISLIF